MRLQFPHLLPSEAIKDWNSRLPMDVRAISPDLLRAAFPERLDLLLASPPMLKSNLPKTHRECTPMGPDVVRHILHVTMYLSETQPEGSDTFGTPLSSIPHP
jgi:hypothetical protein